MTRTVAKGTVEVCRVGDRYTHPGGTFHVQITLRYRHAPIVEKMERGPFRTMADMLTDLGSIAHWNAENAATSRLYVVWNRQYPRLMPCDFKDTDNRVKHLFHIDRNEVGRYMWCPYCKPAKDQYQAA